MKRTFIYLAFVIVIIFTSCSSYRTVSIETLLPSSSVLPNNIVSLTLMNRSTTDEFQNFDKDSLQMYFYKKAFKVNAIFLDSTACDTTLKVLGQLLYESGRYEVVIPQERNIYRGLRFYKMPQELDWDYVQNICNLYNTDALLVLERYYNKLNTNYKLLGYSYNGDEVMGASIDSKYDAVVRVYDPKEKAIVRTLSISDTIYWYQEDITQSAIFKSLPSIKEVLTQSGIQTALDIDEKLSPSWKREQRGYFSIGKADSASTYIDQADWESAYNYWLPIAESRNKTLRSKVEFNLALASEMLDDIDLAIEWAKKSYYSVYRQQTESYLTKLANRKKYLQKMEGNRE